MEKSVGGRNGPHIQTPGLGRGLVARLEPGCSNRKRTGQNGAKFWGLQLTLQLKTPPTQATTYEPPGIANEQAKMEHSAAPVCMHMPRMGLQS